MTLYCRATIGGIGGMGMDVNEFLTFAGGGTVTVMVTTVPTGASTFTVTSAARRLDAENSQRIAVCIVDEGPVVVIHHVIAAGLDVIAPPRFIHCLMLQEESARHSERGACARAIPGERPKIDVVPVNPEAMGT